ncbi:hypothetical protein K461DRAFT_294968 [Myriangium duriaei CBS 260.36]|uniref:Rhodopsin domain-containing protein n=1 Tax=Myriangium duriaei CBS 260.36 TaxID=1168546 RepID=A0A9P4MJJ4_9PEZI|nr:hypothetical protein K461DRAFT_294968 [Myriangium duriaei CBS 260.36]
MSGYGLPSAFGADFCDRLAKETYSLYAVGIVMVSLRIFARLRKLGFRGLQIDDYIMITAAAWYTVLAVNLNFLAQSAGTALPIPGEDLNKLSDNEVAARTHGAKITFIAEQAMLNTIWTLKACLLLMYSRLTLSTKQHMFVKFLAVYTALGWIACQLALFTQCRPFTAYWQIRPAPNLNCMVYWTYAAIQCTFNISSDLAMLSIPLPMIAGVKIPPRQKAILLILFSMGVFVVIAAALTKINFWISIYDADFMFWYFREASVAVYVANLPFIWPLARDMIPGLRSFFGASTHRSSRPAYYGRSYGRSNHTGLHFTGHGTIKDINSPDLESASPDLTKAGRDIMISAHPTRRNSDEDDLLRGIKAETTIEMSVMDNSSERSSAHPGAITPRPRSGSIAELPA